MQTRLTEKMTLRAPTPLSICHNEYRSQSEGRSQRNPMLKHANQSLDETIGHFIDISEDSRHPYQGMLASSSEKYNEMIVDHEPCNDLKRKLEVQLEEAL